VQYQAFVDPSGGGADAMTLAIAHGDSQRVVLDALAERPPPFSPEGVVEDFARRLAPYHIATVVGDRYAGEWPREAFRRHGLSYEIADSPRSDLYRDLLPLITSQQAALLDPPRLVTQLCRLERRTGRGGRDQIDHPPGRTMTWPMPPPGPSCSPRGGAPRASRWPCWTSRPTPPP
jgi:hypothetical protein